MEDINDVSEDNPSVIRGLFFIVTPEENDIQFRVRNSMKFSVKVLLKGDEPKYANDI